MSQPLNPAKTEAARRVLAGPRGALSVPLRMLLISVDGQRSLDQLLVISRSLGLDDVALERLQRDGLITRPRRAASAAAPVSVHAPAPPRSAPPPVVSGDDLRRLMKAKMFALDLAGRMLAGRDVELRLSAREVDSEARFLDWLADASARIEAASDAGRAKLFRERIAAAAA